MPEPLEEILHVVVEARARLATHPALAGPHEQADVARWLASVLHVAMLTNHWARADRPRFVDITAPTLRWGGDNPDATYAHVALAPELDYRVRVRPGSAVYSSLTVYGGPRDGHYSTRIVGSIRVDELTVGADGWCELFLARDLAGRPGVQLADDTEVGITRDYYRSVDDRVAARWEVEVLSGGRPEEEAQDAALERTRNWLADQVAIVPVELEANTVQPPYPVPEHTLGWAAGDASYAMGSFDLEPGEQLVLRGRSPACSFWNVCLWNPLLHGYDAEDGCPTSLHDGQVVLDDDGSWTIVLGAEPHDARNAMSSQGRRRGLIWFRWFLPDETPAEVTAELRRAGG